MDAEHYESDFDSEGREWEEEYDADFESDGELEVPPHRPQASQLETPAPLGNKRAWTGLAAAAGAVPVGHLNRLNGPSQFKSCGVPFLSSVCLSEERQRSAVKLRRSLALQSQVRLAEVALPELLHLESQRPYDLLCRREGRYARSANGSSQAPVRGQDSMEEAAQTDEVDAAHAACQAPHAGSTRGLATASAASINSSDSSNHRALQDFVLWAAEVLLLELGLSAAAPASAATAVGLPICVTNTACSALSAGSCRLSCEPLLAGRRLVGVAVAPPRCAASHLAGRVCCAYLPSVEACVVTDHSLSSLGCLCVWDTHAPEAPEMVFVCEGRPSCCCWGAGPCSEVAVAGMEEGGICVWDACEPAASHQSDRLGSTDWPTRRPSYTTEAHALTAPVVEPVVAVAAVGWGADSRAACRLVALSCNGHVSVYSLQQLGRGEAAAAADADMGMRPGSVVRLVDMHVAIQLGRPATRRGASRSRPSSGPGRDPALLGARCLALLPDDDASGLQLLVGAGRGEVLRGAVSRELQGVPWAYTPEGLRWPLVALPSNKHPAAGAAAEPHTAAPRPALPAICSQVVDLDVSPSCPGAVIVAHSDGMLALHTMSRAAPVITWKGLSCGEFVAVRWCPCRPCVFLALDVNGCLIAVDLIASASKPAAQVLVMAMHRTAAVLAAAPPTARAARACALEVFPCAASAQLKSEEPCPARGGCSVKVKACAVVYVLGFDTGSAECHLLPPGLGELREGEQQRLQQILL